MERQKEVLEVLEVVIDKLRIRIYKIIHSSKKGKKMSEIHKLLKSKVSKSKLKSILKELEVEGKVFKKGNKFYSLKNLGLVFGVFRGKDGYGFVEDFIIPSRYRKGAISGDLVIVEPIEEGKIRTVGKIIKIVKRKELFIGTYRNGKVYPDDISIARSIKIENKVSLEDGVKVLFKVSRRRKLKAKIVEVIGKIDEPDVDLKVVIKTYNLPLSFEKEVEQEVEAISDKVVLSKNRLDLRDELIYTIDPMDAKDYDDAISIKKEGENYILGVHIADVSHYVRLNTNLDKSARSRATSVYLLDFVIPMLPYKLSNYLASLQPAKDRYAFSVIMKIDKYGNVLDRKFYKSVISSKARLTYEDAQEILENRKPKHEFTKFADDSYIGKVSENLKLARELSYILREKREKEGSLDFDLPEPYFVRNENGEIVDIIPKIRLDTHRIVEDFMILANMVVAEYFSKNNIPAIYRVHDRPNIKKIKNFIVIAKNILNIEIPMPEKITSLEISKILKKVKNSENEDLLTYLLLRSMAKAKYSTNNIGHFGLALKHYTHFTSPIRRYADLVVHRILYSSMKNKVNRSFDYIEELDEIAKHCSKMEEISEDAEWDLWESKKLDFMKNKVGEVFEAIVSGFSDDGIFVEIKEHLVEGIVPVDNINIDENRYLAYINSKVFTLGQKVKVKVIKVIKEFKKMTLSLLDV